MDNTCFEVRLASLREAAYDAAGTDSPQTWGAFDDSVESVRIVYDKLRAENERLREALQEAVDLAHSFLFSSGPYIDQEDLNALHNVERLCQPRDKE